MLVDKGPRIKIFKFKLGFSVLYPKSKGGIKITCLWEEGWHYFPHRDQPFHGTPTLVFPLSIKDSKNDVRTCPSSTPINCFFLTVRWLGFFPKRGMC